MSNDSSAPGRSPCSGNIMEDFSSFSSYAFKYGLKRGFMKEKATIRYYSLFGNLLFVYKRDDAQSFVNVVFMEGAAVRASPGATAEGNYCISVTTVGGKYYMFVLFSESDQQEWVDAFRKYLFVKMLRLSQDLTATSMHISNRVEVREEELMMIEAEMAKKNDEHVKLQDRTREFEATIKGMELEIAVLGGKLRGMELDKLNLLRTKGITPRRIPLWALPPDLPSNGRGSSNNLIGYSANNNGNSSVGNSASKSVVLGGGGGCPELLKVWVGTWNMGSSSPLDGIDSARAHSHLRPFVPSGYDLYVLGLQECLGESMTDAFDSLMRSRGCERVGSWGADPDAEQSAESRIYGRGDSRALVSSNFAELLIYVNSKYSSDSHLISSAQLSFSSISCHGANAHLITIFGKTILFINSHLDSKSIENRRAQYNKLLDELGGMLAEPGFPASELFHHIIWSGDLNYDLVDAAGSPLSAAEVVKQLEENQCRALFESNDQLNLDKRNQMSFYGFKEPIPYPNFYPTFKKIRRRKPVDYTNKSWVKETYVLKKKDPFYKSISGSGKDVVPKFCDRILFHSLVDTVEDLIPECVQQELLLHQKNDSLDINLGKAAKAAMATSRSSISGNMTNSSSASEQNEIVNVGLSAPPKLPQSLVSVIDNYQSVNDGEIYARSDHSPVFATFLLRLLHSHGDLLSDFEQDNIEILSPITPPPQKYTSNSRHNLSEIAINEVLFDVDLAGSKPAQAPSTPISKSSPAPAPALNGLISPEKLPKSLRYSSLPVGPRKFRISNIKLLWGTYEDVPYKVEILFPLPFEAVNGGKFVQFFSELNSESKYDESPSRQSMSRASISSPARNNPSSKFDGSSCGLWRQKSGTKSGTGMLLEFDMASLDGSSISRQSQITPLQLSWSGDEPLDRLHMAVKVSVPSSSFNSKRRSDDELATGYCAFGLDQLCKTALASSIAAHKASGASISSFDGGNVSGSISMARLLKREGAVMHLVDPKALQRDKVTFCCNLDLLPANSE